MRGIAFTRFTSADVVRHPLVQKIIDAYERDDATKPTTRRRGSGAAGRDRPMPTAFALASSTTSRRRRCPRRATLRRWARPRLERDAAVTLRFVGTREGRTLNARYRGKDYATNVLDVRVR